MKCSSKPIFPTGASGELFAADASALTMETAAAALPPAIKVALLRRSLRFRESTSVEQAYQNDVFRWLCAAH
jgi:hypothetical protein